MARSLLISRSTTVRDRGGGKSASPARSSCRSSLRETHEIDAYLLQGLNLVGQDLEALAEATAAVEGKCIAPAERIEGFSSTGRNLAAP